jgi:hypothetical protein
MVEQPIARLSSSTVPYRVTDVKEKGNRLFEQAEGPAWLRMSARVELVATQDGLERVPAVTFFG